MDRELLDFGVRALVTLLAVVDPVGNVPFFITATEGMTAFQRRQVALRAFVVSSGVLAAFALGGTAVMWLFHLTMPAVRIGGGVILLVIALKMLSGRQFDWERDQPAVEPGKPPERAGVVPLAIPLMAGPGAMSSVIALSAQAHNVSHLAATLAAILLVCGAGYVCYYAAVSLTRYLGRTAMVTLSCLMGLILAALSVQFMLDGLRQAMPSLFQAP